VTRIQACYGPPGNQITSVNLRLTVTSGRSPGAQEARGPSAHMSYPNRHQYGFILPGLVEGTGVGPQENLVDAGQQQVPDGGLDCRLVNLPAR
jgi:hypothetical protein